MGADDAGHFQLAVQARELLVPRAVRVRGDSHAHADHRVLGMLRSAQGVAVHARLGKCQRKAHRALAGKLISRPLLAVLLLPADRPSGRGRHRSLRLPIPGQAGRHGQGEREGDRQDRVQHQRGEARSFQPLPVPSKHSISPPSAPYFINRLRLVLQLECCGAESPLDWKTSKFNSYPGVNLELTSSEKTFKVPTSCCRWNTTKELCAKFEIGIGASNVKDISTKGVIYTKGCTEQLLNVLQNNLVTISVVFVSIVGIEIIALLISLCLCCAVGGREDHYKS